MTAKTATTDGDKKGKALFNRFIVARYVTLVLLGIAGIVAGSLAVACNTGQHWTRLLQLAGFSSWQQITAATLLAALIAAHLLFQLAPLRSRHFREWRYPPIWVAVALALLLLPAISVRFPGRSSYTQEDWLLGAGWLLLAVLVVKLVEQLLRELTRPPKIEESSTAFRHLSENPIDRPEQDAFGLDPIAVRIASGLQRRSHLTVGLVGDYGTGKTSLAKLIEHHGKRLPSVEGEPRLWFSHTSCWGFADSRSAIQEVLEDAIREVDNHVDSLTLRTLPTSYLEAVSASTGVFKHLSAFLGGLKSAESRLERLVPILAALNVRLVIVLEELDRGDSRVFGADEVLAMLLKVKKTPCLSFILTGGHKDGPKSVLAFTKLCDHLEPMPSLSESAISQTIQEFRDEQMSLFTDIDPTVNGATTRGFLWQYHRPQTMLARSIGKSVEGWLLDLLRTPREFKHVIRHTADIWEILHGEIDFDELLCVSALRIAAPSAVAFLERHLGDFRVAIVRQEGKGLTDGTRADAARLDHLWENVASSADFNVEAATALVDYLVPGIAASKYFKGQRRIGLQGIAGHSPTNYLGRITTAAIAPGEVRDQEVLAAIARVAESDDHLLPLAKQMAASHSYTQKWEHFSAHFPSDKLLQLASLTLGYASALGWDRHSTKAEAWISVWRTAQHRPPVPHAVYVEWLWDVTTKAVTRNIGVANDIYHYWASTEFGLCEFAMREQVRDDLRQRTYRWAASEWPKMSPQQLADVINGPAEARGWELFQFMFPGSVRESPSLLTEYSDWSWAGELIYTAAVASPEKLVRQVANLLFSHQRGSLGPVNGPLMRGVFGESAEAMVKWMVDHSYLLPVAEGEDPNAPRELATKWLLVGEVVETSGEDSADEDSNPDESSGNSPDSND